jgi:multicomponent Na+:H+ antiporter subunit F
MKEILLGAGIYLTVLMILSLYRALKGPTLVDRIIGVGAVGSKTSVLLVLIGTLYGRVEMFVDIALAYSMLNFIAVLASSRYLHKRRGLHDETV